MAVEFIGTIFELTIAGLSAWALYELVMVFVSIPKAMKEHEGGEKIVDGVGEKVKNFFGDDFGDFFDFGGGSKGSSTAQTLSKNDLSKKSGLVKVINQLHSSNTKIKDNALKITLPKNFEEYLRYVYNESNRKDLYTALKYVLEVKKIIDKLGDTAAKLNEQSISYLNTLADEVSQIVDLYKTWDAELKIANEALIKKNDKKKIKSPSDAIAIYRNLDNEDNAKKLLDESYTRFGKLTANLTIFVRNVFAIEQSILDHVKYRRETTAELEEQENAADKSKIKDWKTTEKYKEKETKYKKEIKAYTKSVRETLQDFVLPTVQSIKPHIQRYNAIQSDGAFKIFIQEGYLEEFDEMSKLQEFNFGKFQIFERVILDLDASLRKITGNRRKLANEGVLRLAEVDRGDKPFSEQFIMNQVQSFLQAFEEEDYPLIRDYESLLRSYSRLREILAFYREKELNFEFKFN